MLSHWGTGAILQMDGSSGDGRFTPQAPSLTCWYLGQPASSPCGTIR